MHSFLLLLIVVILILVVVLLVQKQMSVKESFASLPGLRNSTNSDPEITVKFTAKTKNVAQGQLLALQQKEINDITVINGVNINVEKLSFRKTDFSKSVVDVVGGGPQTVFPITITFPDLPLSAKIDNNTIVPVHFWNVYKIPASSKNVILKSKNTSQTFAIDNTKSKLTIDYNLNTQYPRVVAYINLKSQSDLNKFANALKSVDNTISFISS